MKINFIKNLFKKLDLMEGKKEKKKPGPKPKNKTKSNRIREENLYTLAPSQPLHLPTILEERSHLFNDMNNDQNFGLQRLTDSMVLNESPWKCKNRLDDFQDHVGRGECGPDCINEKAMCKKTGISMDIVQLSLQTTGPEYDYFHEVKVPPEYKHKARDFYEAMRREATETYTWDQRAIIERKWFQERDVRKLQTTIADLT